VSCFKAGYGAAAFARFAGKSCEARLREAGWWAREDSNLQPSGYERVNFTGNADNFLYFCARPQPFVLVWLQRFIGLSLVHHTARFGDHSGTSCVTTWKGSEVRSLYRPP
jgi:hypothetical protein